MDKNKIFGSIIFVGVLISLIKFLGLDNNIIAIGVIGISVIGLAIIIIKDLRFKRGK